MAQGLTLVKANLGPPALEDRCGLLTGTAGLRVLHGGAFAGAGSTCLELVELRCGRLDGGLGAQEGWGQQWATWLKEQWTSLVRMEDSVQGLTVGSLRP